MGRSVLLRVEQTVAAGAVRRACTEAIAAGFDGIELVWTGSLPQAAATDSDPHETSSGTSAFEVVAVAAACHATEIAPALGHVVRMLHESARLGARCLNLTLPTVRPAAGDVGFARYQEALNFAHHLLRAARHDAEASGVVLALEVATGGCLLSPVEVREFIDTVNSCAVGACICVTSVARIGSVVDWLNTLRHRVAAVRVNDLASAGAVSGDKPSRGPVKKDEDLRSIAAALNEINREEIVILAGAAAQAPALVRLFASEAEKAESERSAET